jgi:hypothetical protein
VGWGVQKLNLQHGFQLGEQSLPQSKHNAGSSGTEPQSGHCILTYLVDKKTNRYFKTKVYLTHTKKEIPA